MRDFEGKVGVVTGAASGIGLAMATRFASEGMRVVLADVERDPLQQAAAELAEQGRDVLAVEADVSDSTSVQALAAQTMEAFGGVHLVCNNAGVGASQVPPVWEVPERDWDWVLGVNFQGVLHGVQAFVPLMLAGGDEGHIVNTGSVWSLTAGGSAYGVSKHAVLSLSETLSQDLRRLGAPIGVSVLCPGFVQTQIMDAQRNRPEADRTDRPSDVAAVFQARFADGLVPEKIADAVAEAVRDDMFYVLPSPGWDLAVRERVDRILRRELPLSPMAPDQYARIEAAAQQERDSTSE